MDFIDKERLTEFKFTPSNAKCIHPLLDKDNYLTYALVLAHNKNLTDEERTFFEQEMKRCYKREEMEFTKLEERKLLSHDITEEISNE
jgi:hypothetical protein